MNTVSSGSDQRFDDTVGTENWINVWRLDCRISGEAKSFSVIIWDVRRDNDDVNNGSYRDDYNDDVGDENTEISESLV